MKLIFSKGRSINDPTMNDLKTSLKRLGSNEIEFVVLKGTKDKFIQVAINGQSFLLEENVSKDNYIEEIYKRDDLIEIEKRFSDYFTNSRVAIKRGAKRKSRNDNRIKIKYSFYFLILGSIGFLISLLFHRNGVFENLSNYQLILIFGFFYLLILPPFLENVLNWDKVDFREMMNTIAYLIGAFIVILLMIMFPLMD